MNGYHQPPHFRSALSYSAGLPDLPQPQDDLASRINGRAQPPAASYVPSAIANADYMAHRKAGEAGSRASIASTTSVGSSASGMGGNFFGGPPYPCSMMPPSPSSSSFPMKSSASMGSIYSGADDRVAAVHRWNASESSGTPPRPGSSRTVGGMERAGTLGPDVGSGLGGSHGRDRRSLYQTPSGSSSSLGAEGLGPSMSRDFLVPIGATGARQKLSIVNATQRRRPPTADTALRIHRETRDVSSSEQANLGGSEVVDDAPPASTQWHNTVPRSRSEGNGALAQSGARPSTSSGSSVYAKDRSDGSDHPGSSDRPTSFDGRASQIRAQQMSEFGRSRSTPQGLNFPNSGSANGSGSLPSRRPDRMDSNPGINSSSFYQGSNASSSSSLVPPRSLDLRSSSSDNVFSLGGPSSFKRSETPTPTQERSNPMMNAQLSAPDLTSWKPETSFLEPKTPPPSSSGERRQSEAPMTDPIRHDSRFPESPWGSTSLQGSPVMTRDGSAAGFNGRQISSDASKAAKILGSPDRPSGGFRAAMSKSGSKTFRNLFSRKESQKATPPPTTTNAESYKRSMLASSMEDERSRSPLQSRSQRRVDDVPGSPVILHAQTIRHEKSSSSVEPLDLALSYTSTFPQPPMLDFSLPSSGGLFDDGEAVNNKADGGEDQAESHDLPQQYRLKLSGLDSDDSSDEADRAHASRSSTKDTSVSGSHSPDSPARERSGSLSGTSASLPSAASTTSTFLPEAAELKLDFADLSSLFPDYYGHDVTEALNSESTTARAAVPAEQQARTDSGVASGGSMGAAREEELGLTPRALAQLQANSLLTGSALPTTDKSLPPTPTASSPLTPATPQRTDGATLERTPQPSALRQDLVRGQDLQGDAAPFAGSAVEPSSMNAASPSLNSSISDVEDAHRRAETEMVGPSIRQPIGVGTLQGSGSRPASRSADRPMTAEDGSPSGRATPTQESTISTVPAPSSSRAERSEAWESTSPLMSPRRRPSALSPSLGSSTLAGSNTVAQALLASLAAQKLHASQTAKGVTEEAAQSLDSKPAPAVSKAASRPASIQPDPATLARLENAPLKATSSTPLEAAADTAASKKAKRAEGIDPATYVPAGALSRTRRGAAVSANAAVELQTSSDSARSNQAVNEVEARPSVSSLASGSTPLSPQGQSRFSIASTDDSSVAASADDSSSVAQTDSDSQKASGRGQEDDAETTTDGASVDGQTLPVSAWIEVEAALRRFIDASISTPVDKGALLRSVLLPFLALEAETPNVEVSGEGQFTTGKSRRSLFFEWIRYLLLELQHVQTSADRGAILESIACIIESRNFSTMILQTDPEDDARFSSVFGHILSYAIGELNKKGVYQNTLIFSGRLLAVAFFRVDGVASKLLRALPVNRFALERVANEADWENLQPKDFEQYRQRFPATLRELCFQDARPYLKMLDSQTTAHASDETEDDKYLVRQLEVEVEMTGNWLRRWQSDDSELFFSFCRSYHRQLAGLFTSSKTLESVSRLYFGSPGYAHLATCIHQKCLSLVHRDILSVTTLSSQKNFNPGETANVLSGSTAGKPRHLEAANRRCTAIVVDIIRAPSANHHIFGPMLGVHVKSLVKRTSLFDVQGVFCLLDWLDGVLTHIDTAELSLDGLIDVDFVIHMISLLLEEADHALALMRTIAFCYSNFAVLTSTKRNRERFCEEILLKPKIFQKLFLSWSFTIRAYFLHLLVFRLARINDFATPADDLKGKSAVQVARLFNQRLDEIRKRHDELSPSFSDESSEDDEEDFVKFKRRTAMSFVSTIKHTPSIHRPEAIPSTSKAERVLGIGMPDPVLAPKGQSKNQSRAAKWLRALGAKGTKGKGVGVKNGSGGLVPPIGVDNPLINNEPRRKVSTASDFPDIDEFDGSLPSEPSSPISSDPPPGDGPPAEGGSYEFQFEGRPVADSTDQIEPGSADTSIDTSFDLQSPTSALPPSGGQGGSVSPRTSAISPRVSRAFSKRSSILPGPAIDILGGEPEPPVPPLPAHLRKPTGYEKSLHVYAVQSLREYEQTVQEHDEFFASQPPTEKPQVPRLPVNWPSLWSDSA